MVTTLGGELHPSTHGIIRFIFSNRIRFLGLFWFCHMWTWNSSILNILPGFCFFIGCVWKIVFGSSCMGMQNPWLCLWILFSLRFLWACDLCFCFSSLFMFVVAKSLSMTLGHASYCCELSLFWRISENDLWLYWSLSVSLVMFSVWIILGYACWNGDRDNDHIVPKFWLDMKSLHSVLLTKALFSKD